MKIEAFGEFKTGQLIPITPEGRYRDHAFVPNPLPPAWEPDAAVWKLIAEARDRVASRTRELADVYFGLGLLAQESRGVLATSPYPYGVKDNRKVLETIAEYSHEQGLTPRVVKLDEVFAPSTLEL